MWRAIIHFLRCPYQQINQLEQLAYNKKRHPIEAHRLLDYESNRIMNHWTGMG